ncbi:hypothetical protein Tco_0278271 [Tanacetum coccineum]
MIFCTIKSKPLALPWGRTPRLDSGVRVCLVLGFPSISVTLVVAGVGPLSGKGPQQSFRSDADVLRTDRLIDGSADGRSTRWIRGRIVYKVDTRTGTLQMDCREGRSLGIGAEKPMRNGIWALPWPVIDRFSPKSPGDNVAQAQRLVGDASTTWSVADLLSSGLWQLFTSFHALLSRLGQVATHVASSKFGGVTIPTLLPLTSRASLSSFSIFRDSDIIYIPDEVHPTAPGRDRTITQFPEGKVGVYARSFDYCGYRIPLTKIFVSVLKYFRIHISQLSPFGAARISHFEVLTRILELGPSMSVFRAFYTHMYSDGLFSFAKRSLSAPSYLSKPPDSIKNWADHFFWVDSRRTVRILSSNKAPFRRYPECFLALVGLSPYYPFGENTYPAFEGLDRTDMGLLDYIRTADPRKHCFVSLDAPAAAHQASGSGSGTGAEVSAPPVEGNVVEENVIPESAFFASRQTGLALLGQVEVACSLRPESLLEGSLTLGTFSPADIPTHVTVPSSYAADAPVYTAADIVTSSRGKTLVLPMSGVGGSSQPKTSEESTDSFYETAALNSEDAKHWYIPRWNITNDSLLDDGFSCRTLVDRICLGLEVRSRAKHELKLKEKLRAKYDVRGVLLSEKDAEIARLKSLLKEKETESAEVLYLRDQVSVLAAEKSSLSAESSLDDSQAACDEAKNLISCLSSERDGLVSEVSTLHSAFRDFKEKMEAQLFLLDGPLANLPEAAYLQPCLEQLSVPIYYADVNAVVRETSLSFALLIIPTSSQSLLGEASTSAVAFCVDALDTDEDLGSVVYMPHLEDPRFEILP